MTLYLNHFLVLGSEKQSMNNRNVLCMPWMKRHSVLIVSSDFWAERMFWGQSYWEWRNELVFEPFGNFSWVDWKWQEGGMISKTMSQLKETNPARGIARLGGPAWYLTRASPGSWCSSLSAKTLWRSPARLPPPPVSSHIPPPAIQSDDHTQMSADADSLQPCCLISGFFSSHLRLFAFDCH